MILNNEQCKEWVPYRCTSHWQFALEMNLYCFRLPICVMCASIFALIWVYLLEQPDPNIVPYYHLGVITFAGSTVVEILAEPVRMVSQIMLYSRLRV